MIRVEKTITVTFLVGLGIQAGAIVWAAAMMNSDIANNSKNINTLENRMSNLENSVNEQRVSLARIDENIKMIKETLVILAEK